VTEHLDMITDQEFVDYLATRGWTTEVIPSHDGTKTRRLLWSPWKDHAK